MMTHGPMAASQEQRRILIVDDKVQIRNILKLYLVQAGHEVLEAGSALQALGLVEEKPVDLILLDVMMPEMHGLEFLERMRTNSKIVSQPAVIMLSARGSRADIMEAMEKGANDYIVKPFTKTIILEKVKKHLRPLPSPTPPKESSAASETPRCETGPAAVAPQGGSTAPQRPPAPTQPPQPTDHRRLAGEL